MPFRIRNATKPVSTVSDAITEETLTYLANCSETEIDLDSLKQLYNENMKVSTTNTKYVGGSAIRKTLATEEDCC